MLVFSFVFMMTSQVSRLLSPCRLLRRCSAYMSCFISVTLVVLKWETWLQGRLLEADTVRTCYLWIGNYHHSPMIHRPYTVMVEPWKSTCLHWRSTIDQTLTFVKINISFISSHNRPARAKYREKDIVTPTLTKLCPMVLAIPNLGLITSLTLMQLAKRWLLVM